MFTHTLDITFFALYIAFNIALGLWVARRNKSGARDYFLAGDRLPWYAIGASIIAANISTEHFIGMVGAAYAFGFVLAQWEWGNVITFSVLIWIFLPYYLRGGLYTMPEFLERRYSTASRTLFAGYSLILWIIAQLAVVMLAGARAMEGMFDLNPFVTILALAVLAGSYTIYGGLISVTWTDVLQFVVMMGGGLVVTVVGLHAVGGPFELMHAAPQRFKFIYPATDPWFPWLGVYTLFFSIGIWYNCTNQFIVQRCLGARSEWDARMGVVFAGFMKILLPFLVVIPGIIAYKLYPNLERRDEAYPTLVRELLPGWGGLVMAGLVSAVLSHLSSVLNSCSTVFTMDLYRPFWGKGASDARLVRVGRWSAFVMLAAATGLGLWFTTLKQGVFDLIQDVGAWVAAPISTVFLLGVLWRRATAKAALSILLLGLPYTWLVQEVFLKGTTLIQPLPGKPEPLLHTWFVAWGWVDPHTGAAPAWLRGPLSLFDGLQPYDNWLNRTLIVWLTCMIGMVVISLVTRPPEADRVKDIIWTWKTARLPESERERNRGLRNLFLWWAIFVGIMACLYAYIIWFQFWGPGSRGAAGP